MSPTDSSDESPGPPPWPPNWLPVHVPADIWRLIFKMYIVVAEKVWFHMRVPQNRGHRAHILCLICSQWRKIATEAPELWSEISMIINNSGKCSPSPQLLVLILQRAGSMPLKISLSFANPEQLPAMLLPATHNALRVLFENFYRAHDLDINVDLCGLLPATLDGRRLEDILHTRTPSLRNLRFHTSPTQSAINPSLSRIWTLSPNLRRVVFDISQPFDYSLVTNVLQIPFGQLRSLTISSISPFHLYDLMSNYRNLAEVVVCSLVRTFDDELDGEPIFLPALERLSFTTTGSLAFVWKLKTPTLTDLDLGNSDEDWSHAEFSSFLANSACSIQHFGLNISYDDTEEKLESLRLLTDLSTLTLRMEKDDSEEYRKLGDFNAKFIRELGRWDKSRKEFPLLPRLKKISIDWVIIPWPHMSTEFSDMIEDRRIAVKVTEVEEEDDKHLPDWMRWAPIEILRLLVLKCRGFDVELRPPLDLDPALDLERRILYQRYVPLR